MTPAGLESPAFVGRKSSPPWDSVQPDELEIALEELETRLERLRALYEQYFLGIEKIEPAVARKDVDRRIWLLRRVQIRNTARRFKLQTLIQRYNTFQQYWARICREIENGTYTRHLLKAQKKVGVEPLTWAAKKRFGRRPRTADGDGDAIEEGAEAQPTRESEWPSAEPTAAALASDLTARPRDAAASPALSDSDPLLAALSAATVATHRDRSSPPRAGAAILPRTQKPRVEPLHLDLDLDDEEEAPPAQKPRLPLPKAKPALPGNAAKTSPSAAMPEAIAGPPRAPTPASPPPSPVKPAPAAPIDRTKPATQKIAEQPGLSDQRIQQLHAELIAVKKQLNQTSNVSVDGLGKSLRATANKLREKAQGRAVDFEVVVKDGQAVVRPVVRK